MATVALTWWPCCIAARGLAVVFKNWDAKIRELNPHRIRAATPKRDIHRPGGIDSEVVGQQIMCRASSKRCRPAPWYARSTRRSSYNKTRASKSDSMCMPTSGHWVARNCSQRSIKRPKKKRRGGRHASHPCPRRTVALTHPPSASASTYCRACVAVCRA
jgi:hypothetical protein